MQSDPKLRRIREACVGRQLREVYESAGTECGASFKEIVDAALDEYGVYDDAERSEVHRRLEAEEARISALAMAAFREAMGEQTAQNILRWRSL